MNKPHKTLILTLFIGVIFVLSIFINISNANAVERLDQCPTSGGVNECTGQDEYFCGECVTSITERDSPWDLECFSCTWSCPTGYITCGNNCITPITTPNPTCTVRRVTTNECGDCTTTCINQGDTYCFSAGECRTPNCSQGATWNGCECVGSPYIIASPVPSQDAWIKILDNVFMDNAKAITVYGDNTSTILNFGNWHDDATSFQMDVHGALKVYDHILSNALYGANGISAEQIIIGDSDDSIQVQGEICFGYDTPNYTCASTWNGPGGASLWEENGSDIINSNSGSVGVGTIDGNYKFYVEGTTGLSGDATIFSNLYFPMAQDHSIKINNSNTGDGGSLTIEAGDAGASSVGGNIYLNPGSGDTGGDVITSSNVGIGNDDPDVKLVVGNGSDPLGNIIGVNGVINEDTGYEIYRDSINGWFIGMKGDDATGDLILKDNNDSDDVIRFLTDLSFNYDGDDKTIGILKSLEAVDGPDLYIWGGEGDGSSSRDGGHLYLGGGIGNVSNGNVILAHNDGKVGMGTGGVSELGAKLDINGNIMSGSASIGGVTIGSGVSYVFGTIDGRDAGNLNIHAKVNNKNVYINGGAGNGSGSSGDIFLAKRWGNVGIGTTTPSVKLDIDGGIKIGASTGGESVGTISYSENAATPGVYDFYGLTSTGWKSLTGAGTVVVPPPGTDKIFAEFECDGSITCTAIGDSHGVTVDYAIPWSSQGASTITCGPSHPYVVSAGARCTQVWNSNLMIRSNFIDRNTWGIECGGHPANEGSGFPILGAERLSIICSQ